ncbi:MAG TPA: L-histidine N(alpha)-methyltransferase [Bryobacteraceae bacterium]|nr:L-histidine N(alpha)-methyltransferase [Bryobacteraceae bacterium]
MFGSGSALEDAFAREVRAGLTRPEQKTLPCRYFYDDVGSALFEAITCLPEYGLTRADARILKAHADDIVARLPRNVVIAELGSGSGSKTRHILEALRRFQIVLYYPIDVSSPSLEHCVRDLERLAVIVPLEASYLEGLREVASRRVAGQALCVLFLGSTIGNFESESAIDFMYAIRQVLNPGDMLLLGTDMVKPTDRLLAAYDDEAGVTAAFNLNLLARINRELDADFDLRKFEHVVRYTPDAQRIEMHLLSRVYQMVNIPGADLIVDFVPNETICTEACHKFTPSQICEMARLASFRVTDSWTDTEWPFAESLLVAV